jgi:hypothetical protein
VLHRVFTDLGRPGTTTSPISGHREDGNPHSEYAQYRHHVPERNHHHAHHYSGSVDLSTCHVRISEFPNTFSLSLLQEVDFDVVILQHGCDQIPRPT